MVLRLLGSSAVLAPSDMFCVPRHTERLEAGLKDAMVT